MSKVAGGYLAVVFCVGLFIFAQQLDAQTYGQFYMIKENSSLGGQSLGASTLVELSPAAGGKSQLSIYKYHSGNKERNLMSVIEVDTKKFEAIAKYKIPVKLDGNKLTFTHPILNRIEKINLPNDRCDVPQGTGNDTKEAVDEVLEKIREKIREKIENELSKTPLVLPPSRAPLEVKYADELNDSGFIALPVGFSLRENLSPEEKEQRNAWLKDATQTWRDMRMLHDLKLSSGSPLIAKARADLVAKIPDLKKRQSKVFKTLERAANKKLAVDSDTLQEQKNIQLEYSDLVNALETAASASDFREIFHSPELRVYEVKALKNMLEVVAELEVGAEVGEKKLKNAVQSAKDVGDFLDKALMQLKSIDKDTAEAVGYKILVDYIQMGFPVLMSDGSFQRDSNDRMLRQDWTPRRIENALLTLTTHAEMAGFLFDGKSWLTRPGGPYRDLGKIATDRRERKVGVPLAGEENPLYVIAVYKSLLGRAKSNRSFYLKKPTKADPSPRLRTSVPDLVLGSDFMPGSPVRAIFNKGQYSCWDVGDPRLAQCLSPSFEGEGMEAYSLYYTIFSLAADRANLYETTGLDSITHYWSPVARMSTPSWDDGDPKNGETIDIAPTGVTAKFKLSPEEKIYRLKEVAERSILKPSYE